MSLNNNNPPLATLIHGNLTVDIGSDTALYGHGDLNVYRNGNFYGTDNVTNATTGAVTIYGGLGIVKDTLIDANLTDLGFTSLRSTAIDTSAGGFSVTGASAVTISVGAASSFTTTSGNLTMYSSAGTLELIGGLNNNNAITLTASDANGGINLLTGSGTGKIQLTAGSGGIDGVTSVGNISLTANNGSGSFVVNSSAGSQNLTLSLAGQQDSQLLIQSSGINTTLDAIQIQTVNTAGNILVQNSGGLGDGSINLKTGAGGFDLITNTGGSVSLTAQAATTDITNLTNAADQNLTISVSGATDSSLILKSSGTADAITMFTTNATGNIDIYNTAGSGSISLDAASGGYAVVSSGGSLTQTAINASSTYTNTTALAGQDLTISVTGGTDSSVIIQSDGTAADAIKLNATAATGGVLISALGTVELQSSNSVDGIKIGRSTNVPINIGGPSSTTTIYGNLNVLGTTTAIESNVVTIDDNIIIVNNAPSGMSDGGLGIKRYQFAEDNTGGSFGEVVQDTPTETGTAGSTNTATTIELPGALSTVTDYYSGWWIRITAGTGAGQVRRINTYNGGTKIATIYTTADQTASGVVPIEGLDFTTTPDNTSVYALYPCYYILSIWDESANEFAIVCSPLSPLEGNSAFVHYVDFHADNITATNIDVDTINGLPADSPVTFILDNTNTNFVNLFSTGNNYGVYIVLVRPTTVFTSTYAIFAIARPNAAVSGQVVRLVSVRGAGSEQLDMQWNSGAYPQIQYRPAPSGGSGTRSFTARLITI